MTQEQSSDDANKTARLDLCIESHRRSTPEADQASAVSDLQPSGAGDFPRRLTLVTITPDPDAPFDAARALRSEEPIDGRRLAALMAGPRLVKARLDLWPAFTACAFAWGLAAWLIPLIEGRAP